MDHTRLSIPAAACIGIRPATRFATTSRIPVPDAVQQRLVASALKLVKREHRPKACSGHCKHGECQQRVCGERLEGRLQYRIPSGQHCGNEGRRNELRELDADVEAGNHREGGPGLTAEFEDRRGKCGATDETEQTGDPHLAARHDRADRVDRRDGTGECDKHTSTGAAGGFSQPSDTTARVSECPTVKALATCPARARVARSPRRRTG